jgi:hypothetical protein
MRSIGETATVLVAAVKSWSSKSAREQTLIIKMNKKILAKRGYSFLTGRQRRI